MSVTSLQVRPLEHGWTLRDFLARRLKVSQREAKRLLDDRRVFVNRVRVWMARHPLAAGDVVEILKTASSEEIRVLYRDEDYLIVNKPPGLESTGSRGVEGLLRERLNLPHLAAVHRLDRDTTGCLWLALNEPARNAAVERFHRGEVRKRYEAIVAGRVGESRFTVRRPVDGLPATTRVAVRVARPWASWLMIEIETGRTHQIRRHLASCGHPILGDKLYFTGEVADDRLREIPRQMLHAVSLSFAHPRTNEPVRVVAPRPADFRVCLQKLRLL